MTTTTNHRTTPRPDATVSALPFTQQVRAELRRTASSRSGRWLLTAAGAVLLAVLAVQLSTADPEDLAFRDFVQASATPLSLLLPLLGILAATTRWKQRTSSTTSALEPTSVRVVLAQLAALVAISLLAVVAALTAAAVANVAGATLLDGSGAWTLAPSAVGDLLLTPLLAVVQGFAFGLLLLSTAGAIVLYYLLTPLWGVVLTLVDSLENAAPWLDLGTAVGQLSEGSASAQHVAQLASAATLWVLLPLALGLLRLKRGEVTPG